MSTTTKRRRQRYPGDVVAQDIEARGFRVITRTTGFEFLARGPAIVTTDPNAAAQEHDCALIQVGRAIDRDPTTGKARDLGPAFLRVRNCLVGRPRNC